jgi:hypothetical protein
MAIVILYDINEFEVSSWARINCASFVSWLIYENEDALLLTYIDEGPDWKIRYEFEFTDQYEAMIFQLRWQGQ